MQFVNKGGCMGSRSTEVKATLAGKVAEARCFRCLCFVWPVTTNARTVKIWQPPPSGTSYVLYKPPS